MHLIYSKLKASNVLSGVVNKKPFSVDFKPEATTKVKDDQYKAFMDEEGSVFEFLHKSGDFIEKAEMVTGDIASLEGALVKAQKALDEAKKAQKNNNEDPVKLAEDALMDAEDALGKAKDANEKKGLMIAVKNAKADLVKAKKGK